MDYSQVFKIAPGHDEVDELLELWALEPPHFWQFEMSVGHIWHSEEATRISAIRRKRKIGLPWIELTLTVVTFADAAYLEANLAGPVTIKAQAKSLDEWRVFNGELQIPEWGEFEQRKNAFLDVVISIVGLEDITPIGTF